MPIRYHIKKPVIHRHKQASTKDNLLRLPVKLLIPKVLQSLKPLQGLDPSVSFCCSKKNKVQRANHLENLPCKCYLLGIISILKSKMTQLSKEVEGSCICINNRVIQQHPLIHLISLHIRVDRLLQNNCINWQLKKQLRKSMKVPPVPSPKFSNRNGWVLRLKGKLSQVIISCRFHRIEFLRIRYPKRKCNFNNNPASRKEILQAT